MIAEFQNAWGASSEEYEGLEALAQWAIRKETKLATMRHIQGSPSTKNSQRETTTPRNPDGTYQPTNNGNQNYGDPMELDVTRKEQHSTSQGKNSREGYENNYASSVHNRDTWPGVARRKMDPNHSTHKPGTGNPRRKPPLGKPDQRSEKSRSNRNPNNRETTAVPSKTWSEGLTRTKTHHHGELLRPTQLHRYTGKRQ